MIPGADHFLKRSQVRALTLIPDDAGVMFVFAHGAGAGMEHHGMSSFADALYHVGIATFRFNFPYMEQGRRSPGSPRKAIETICEAMEYCKENFPGMKLLAGGKSYGGRMTSTAASEGLLEAVNGIVFFGFPLHAPGKPSDSRAEHLYKVKCPMLFLQGTRDKLAALDLLNPVVSKSGAEILVIDGADHSFNVLKSNALTKEEVLERLAEKVLVWSNGLY